ncbi:MAG TPA: GNAT family N-acetyltransferase [Candidatus Limosilactobacillus merdipullorum]|uniref:GNAT family N-acetyltransferase n=1 Tax=Candidatus Limosilactobacillus merdipullorum TaxID=2838653 RepID=A0A9D1QQJ0_9LACO|nr:GNAT family N-acetyltransferase [Candidatus Limosilactobacillus merdipullorum]
MKWIDKSYQELSRDELFAILKLRAAVFNDEQKSYWPDPDDQDSQAHHVWAVDDGKIAAYARYFETDGHATLGRVLVAPDFRRQGLGKELMNHVLAGIKKNYGQLEIVIHAQLYVQKMYEQFNFRPSGDTFIEAQRKHILMKHKPLAQ